MRISDAQKVPQRTFGEIAAIDAIVVVALLPPSHLGHSNANLPPRAETLLMSRVRKVRSDSEMVRDEAEPGSRARLLTAGRVLFARLGYEQTSTSAITRQAATSESQLTRHFEGKRGLLAAIFDESWRGVNQHVTTVATDAGSAISAIEAVLATVIAAFDRDPDLAALFLFEGRRVHTGEQNVVLSQGYLEFVDFLHGLIRRAQAEKSVASAVDVRALCSALIGAAEGMMRDRLMAQRAGGRPPFSQQDVRQVFAALLYGAGPRKSGARVRQQLRRRAHAP